eukprot:jgi/Galph1/3048/GphlegSOOS_G1720.1
MLYTLFVVNKAGGLIYQQNFSEAAAKLSSNDYLRLASTFHRQVSIQAISRQLSPVHSRLGFGIERIETDTFVLQAFQAQTGVKFVVTASPDAKNLKTFLKHLYELYSDYVLKNPFYELDMPIRVEKWEMMLRKALEEHERSNP